MVVLDDDATEVWFDVEEAEETEDGTATDVLTGTIGIPCVWSGCFLDGGREDLLPPLPPF